MQFPDPFGREEICAIARRLLRERVPEGPRPVGSVTTAKAGGVKPGPPADAPSPPPLPHQSRPSLRPFRTGRRLRDASAEALLSVLGSVNLIFFSSLMTHEVAARKYLPSMRIAVKEIERRWSAANKARGKIA
jgi:hypothetical protein